MTMLNGKPIDNTTPSTAPPVVAPAGVTEPRPASPESKQVGFVAGLLALILSLSIPIAGAIVGGIAVGQARKGGYSNPLGLAGLIIGIVMTVIVTAVIIVSVVLGVGLVSAVVDVCRELGPGIHFYNGVTYECG